MIRELIFFYRYDNTGDYIGEPWLPWIHCAGQRSDINSYQHSLGCHQSSSESQHNH